MKRLLTLSLSLAITASAIAQTSSRPVNPLGEHSLHQQFVKELLSGQQHRAQAKTTNIAKKIMSESSYEVYSGDSTKTDSAMYVYSGTHGSRFDFNFMEYDKTMPVTTVYVNAPSISQADIQADSVVIWGTHNDEGSFRLEGINTAVYDADNRPLDAISRQNNLTYLDLRTRLARTYNAQGRLMEAMEYNWSGIAWDIAQKKTFTYNGAGQLIADTLKRYNSGGWDLDGIITYQYDASGNLIQTISSGYRLEIWQQLSVYTQTYYPDNMLKTTTVMNADGITGLLVPFSRDSIGYDPSNQFYTYYQGSFWNKNLGAWYESSILSKTLNAEGLPDTVKYLVLQPATGIYRLENVSVYTYDADGDPVRGQTHYYPADVWGPQYDYVFHYYYTPPSANPVAWLSPYNCDGEPLAVTSSFNPSVIHWRINGNTIRDQYAKWSVGSTVAGGNGEGNTASQIDNATGVFATEHGDVYVADTKNNRIQKWENGALIGVTVAGGNNAGNGLNQLDGPVAVSVLNNDIYIVDKNNNRVVKWTEGQNSGIVVAGGNGAGNAAGQLNSPSGLFVTLNGDLYVADELNHRIEKWTPGAVAGIKVAGKPAGPGSGLNGLNHPMGVYVTSSNDIYISDRNNHRMVKWVEGAVNGTLVAGGNGAGADLNQLNSPSAVWVDGAGNTYIADMLNYRIVRWAAGATEGEVIAGGNGAGTGPLRLRRPSGLYLDGSGTMYVADQTNRIQRYSPSIDNLLKVYADGTHDALAVSFNGTVVGTNVTTVSESGVGVSNKSQGNLPDGLELEYINNNCKKLLSVKDATGGNVPGTVSVSVYRSVAIQTFNGRPYVQRHFDIQPASDGAGTITLYVNPADFKSYNTYVNSNGLSSPLLPANGNDPAVSNIYITQFTGAASAGTTGPDNEYDASYNVLIPNSSITATWNAGYWALRFPVASLSGGYFIHAGNTVMKQQATSISEIISETDFHMDVFPNPATTDISVYLKNIGTGAKLQVLDMSGRLLSRQSVSSETATIDLGGFAPGLYLVKYTDETQSRLIKIVKE